MPEFRKKPVTVQAEQFTDPVNPPLGVQRTDCLFWVTTIQGVEVPVSIGEWIIRESDGVHYYPCADEVFRRTYDLGDAPIGFAKVFGHGRDQVLVTSVQDDDNDWTLRFEIQIAEGVTMSSALTYVDASTAKAALGKVTDEMAFSKRDSLKAEFAKSFPGLV